jgi:hypothetical protein
LRERERNINSERGVEGGREREEREIKRETERRRGRRR